MSTRDLSPDRPPPQSATPSSATEPARSETPSPAWQQLSTRDPAHPASPISDDNLAQMRADVDFIVAKLKQQILWSDEEQELLDRVRAWTAWDESYQRSGGTGTPFLDKFLVLLKTHTFSRSTGRMMFGLAGDEWMSAYDGLFYELEGERYDRLRELVGRSAAQGTAHPETAQMQSVYGYVGKRVGLGFWGIMKNMSLTVTSMADAMVWLDWRARGLPGDPPQMAKGVADQYDEAAKAMAGALAEGATPEELERDKREIMEEYGFGDRWGTIVGILMAAGMGGSGVGKGVQLVSKAAQIAQGAQGVETAGRNLEKRIAILRKQSPNATWTDLLADDEVRLNINNGLVALIGVVGGLAGVSGDQNAVANFFSRFGIPLAVASVIPQLQQAWVHYSDQKLSEKERDEALQRDLATITGTVLAAIGGHVDEARAKAKAGTAPPEKPPPEIAPPVETTAPQPEPTPAPAQEQAPPPAPAPEAFVPLGEVEYTPEQLEAAGSADVGTDRLGTQEVEWTQEQLEARAAERQGRGRTGDYSPAEVALGARWEWNHELGVPSAAEFDIPQEVGNIDPLGETTRPDKFRQGESPLTPDDFKNTQVERGHVVGQENSRANVTPDLGLPGLGPDFAAEVHAEVARDLMQMDNVWAMRGRGSTGVNQGAFRVAEVMIHDVKVQAAQAGVSADLRCRVEAVFGSPVQFDTAPTGARIPVPLAFEITITATPGPGGAPKTVRQIVVQNIPGGAPVTVIDVPIVP